MFVFARRDNASKCSKKIWMHTYFKIKKNANNNYRNKAKPMYVHIVGMDTNSCATPLTVRIKMISIDILRSVKYLVTWYTSQIVRTPVCTTIYLVICIWNWVCSMHFYLKWISNILSIRNKTCVMWLLTVKSDWTQIWFFLFIFRWLR